MKILLTLLVLLKAQNSLIYAASNSNLNKEKELADVIDGLFSDLEETDLEESPESSTGVAIDSHLSKRRRIGDESLETGLDSQLHNLPRSCMIGSRMIENPDAPKLSFGFSADVDDDEDFPVFGDNAEMAYLNELFSRNFIKADKIRRSGLVLSGSIVVGSYIQSLLANIQFYKVEAIILELIKYQPQVFGQNYEQDFDIFYNATQEAVNLVLEKLSSYVSVREKIFAESLRADSLVILSDSFFLGLRPDRMLRLMNKAQIMRNDAAYNRCCSLIDYDSYTENGETILTLAMKLKNMKLIRCLLNREDAANFINLPNDSDEFPLNLALDLHYFFNMDPDFEVFKSLFDVITSATNFASYERTKEIISQFLSRVFYTRNHQVLEAFKEVIEAVESSIQADSSDSESVSSGEVSVSESVKLSNSRSSEEQLESQVVEMPLMLRLRRSLDATEDDVDDKENVDLDSRDKKQFLAFIQNIKSQVITFIHENK